MKTRRHHNNNGARQVKTGRTAEQVKRMARRLGVRFGTACAYCGCAHELPLAPGECHQTDARHRERYQAILQAAVANSIGGRRPKRT